MPNLSVQVGWLDLSDSEQRRAREYLRQFRTEGTLDELGFGIVRDALADVFFPATNTIMTRTRYLLFVAAALLRVEHERLSGSQAARRLKMLEGELNMERQQLQQAVKYILWIGKLGVVLLD